MILAGARRAAALALLAGALCIADTAAQVPVRPDSGARVDTLRVDSLRIEGAPSADTTGRRAAPAEVEPRADTTKSPADTVKAPIAHAELPPTIEIADEYRWNRERLFSTGAITLGDLLERIPGITRFRPGWLASPDHAAVIGDVGGVRVFYDGIEISPIDQRAAGTLDLNEVQLWTLEEVAVERGADEVRVYLRSWRVERTTPNTRTDILTGDEDTNLYRGFFGKRFRHGEALQLAAQQYGYDARNAGFGGGDQLAVLGRLGIARRRWSVDAFALRASRTRDLHTRFFDASVSIPPLRGTRTDAYLRAAAGDPDAGPWLQLLAAHQRFDEASPADGTADAADTSTSLAQYVATGGARLGRFRLSGAARMHVLRDETVAAITGRAAFETPLLALSLRTEQRGGDTSSVEEATARLTPIPWISLLGAVSRRHGGRGDPPDVLSARAEAGIRLRRLWATGGIMFKDTTTALSAPVLFSPSYVALPDSSSPQGLFGTLRGKIWRDVYANVWAVRWDEPGWYRPQTQMRGELGVNTNWLSRFPQGHFQFIAALALEYRGAARFPTLDGGAEISTEARQLRSLIEVRILDGYVFWQQIYRMSPAQPQLVPGYVVGRQLSVFGARWQFWN